MNKLQIHIVRNNAVKAFIFYSIVH